jgi:putative phage-type endonuclease
MFTDLQQVKIQHGSTEWLHFRNNYIGASEMAAVAGVTATESKPLTPYLSPIRVYYTKVEDMIDTFDNEAMFHGRHLEDYVASLWEYYDGTEDGYIHNFGGKKIRTLSNPDCYFINPKFSWICCSPDRLMNPDTAFNLATGQKIDGGIVEVKNISDFAVKMWQDGFPEYFKYQVQTYCTCLGLEYAEIAIFKSGRNFAVLPYEYDKEMADMILERSHAFFYNRIMPAKEAYKLYKEYLAKGDIKGMEAMQTIIQDKEPPIDDLADCEHFYTERRKPLDKDPEFADDEAFNAAVKYSEINRMITKLNKPKQLAKNQMLYAMDGATTLLLTDGGKVSNVAKFSVNCNTPMPPDERNAFINSILT